MVEHTPGPWPVTRTGDGKRYVIGDGLVDGPNGYEVAEVYSDDCDPDEALANANLIAAAPDLLDAHEAWERAEDARNNCRDCENEGPWEHCGPCSERFGDAIDKRHAAIAKARGQTPSGDL